MIKTPEQMAMDYINKVEATRNPSVTATAFPQMQRCFLAGYQAGVKEAEERILNEFFDNYGADEHASFALRVNAYQWNKNDK